MPRAGIVEIELSRWHCHAMCWWLRYKYFPFIIKLSKQGGMVARTDILNTIQLIPQFQKFSERKLSGDDQDRLALRTFERRHANWLAGFLDTRPQYAPPILVHGGELPSAEVLAALPIAAAQAIVFGIGVFEVIRACQQKVRAKRIGRNQTVRTIEQASDFRSGSEWHGGNERYDRRVRQTANFNARFAETMKRLAE